MKRGLQASTESPLRMVRGGFGASWRAVGLWAPWFLAVGMWGCGATRVERSVISTSEAPTAIGPYSQAVRQGERLYAAGQIGLDPRTGQLVPGGVAAETRRALENLQAVVEAGGFTWADVVQVTVYLVDLEEYGAMNAVYAEFFPQDAPARAAVQVARLPREARVEIILVADRSRR